ncbi:unnamed protein product [Tuber melanosporum]|uniref:(Perigord truffle) hypothetical protein n=1 Tax=Tuber melanosporum (strain Mel28) TaxID=656061 RepID=D5GAT9_TUBMM|nr:uncharacterized protein GSTUM_00005305001 [Tuber melanosporum]CAZ81632.1 unnamed protein product [Tuber melanosporum]
MYDRTSSTPRRPPLHPPSPHGTKIHSPPPNHPPNAHSDIPTYRAVITLSIYPRPPRSCTTSPYCVHSPPSPPVGERRGGGEEV